MTAERKPTLAETLEERRRRINATDRMDPVVEIRMGGRDLKLEATNRAIKAILKNTGLNIITEGLTTEALNDPTILSELLTQCLLKHQPDLTMDQVDDLFDYRHILYVTNKLRESLSLFMPDMTGWEVGDTKAHVPSEKDPT